MPGIEVEIAPPANWQDFERLTLDYARRAWQDDYAERNGRPGQAQAGVDVVGYNSSARETTGIQCKKKQNYASPSKRLTTAEIDDEVTAAKGFTTQLDRLVIATTGPRDANLQAHVRALNDGSQPFKVSLMFWEDYQDFLNNHIDLMYRYYKEVLEYRASYDELEHYLLLLSTAFDRPAIRTPFHLENRATDFIQAISDTQRAIATGYLVDRESHVIDECKIPKPQIVGLKKAANFLQRAREIATQALRDGSIVEHQTVIEIKSHEVSEQLNSLRKNAVALLNKELVQRSFEPVEFCEI